MNLQLARSAFALEAVVPGPRTPRQTDSMTSLMHPHSPAHDWMRMEHAEHAEHAEHILSSFPPPASLVLTGELKDQETSLGVYVLVEDCTVNDCPVWQHISRDRCIAKYRNGHWLVQQTKNVGVNDYCHLRLPDSTVPLPHLSSVMWEEFDSAEARAWIDAPVCQCAEDSGGELALTYLKREENAEREVERKKKLNAHCYSTRSNSSYAPPTRMLCRDCLEDPLKGGSRCFACDPRAER